MRGRAMPPRTVACELCGLLFFPCSLKFHQKACREKQLATNVECTYCNLELPQGGLERHIKKCTAAASSLRALNKANTSAEDVDLNSMCPTRLPDGRMRCPFCNRGFNDKRIQEHITICMKLKKPRKSAVELRPDVSVAPLLPNAPLSPKGAMSQTRSQCDAGSTTTAESARSTEVSTDPSCDGKEGWGTKREDLSSVVRSARCKPKPKPVQGLRKLTASPSRPRLPRRSSTTDIRAAALSAQNSSRTHLSNYSAPLLPEGLPDAVVETGNVGAGHRRASATSEPVSEGSSWTQERQDSMVESATVDCSTSSPTTSPKAAAKRQPWPKTSRKALLRSPSGAWRLPRGPRCAVKPKNSPQSVAASATQMPTPTVHDDPGRAKLTHSLSEVLCASKGCSEAESCHSPILTEGASQNPRVGQAQNRTKPQHSTKDERLLWDADRKLNSAGRESPHSEQSPREADASTEVDSPKVAYSALEGNNSPEMQLNHFPKDTRALSEALASRKYEQTDGATISVPRTADPQPFGEIFRGRPACREVPTAADPLAETQPRVAEPIIDVRSVHEDLSFSSRPTLIPRPARAVRKLNSVARSVSPPAAMRDHRMSETAVGFRRYLQSGCIPEAEQANVPARWTLQGRPTRSMFPGAECPAEVSPSCGFRANPTEAMSLPASSSEAALPRGTDTGAPTWHMVSLKFQSDNMATHGGSVVGHARTGSCAADVGPAASVPDTLVPALLSNAASVFSSESPVPKSLPHQIAKPHPPPWFSHQGETGQESALADSNRVHVVAPVLNNFCSWPGAPVRQNSSIALAVPTLPISLQLQNRPSCLEGENTVVPPLRWVHGSVQVPSSPSSRPVVTVAPPSHSHGTGPIVAADFEVQAGRTARSDRRMSVRSTAVAGSVASFVPSSPTSQTSDRHLSVRSTAVARSVASLAAPSLPTSLQLSMTLASPGRPTSPSNSPHRYILGGMKAAASATSLPTYTANANNVFRLQSRFGV